MELSDKYLKLYNYWQDEFEHNHLTKFNDAQHKLFKTYIDKIKKSSFNFTDPIQKDVVKSYIDNLEFLLKDFFKLRKLKILNRALALEDIDFDKLTEAEKVLYENSVSAIKGYEKLKNITFLDDLISKFKESEQIILSPNKDSSPVGTKPLEITDSDIEAESVESEDAISYLLIRFLKKTPPLVGLDLINYGPFEKEDIALIPLKNAEILIKEKHAEIIEI